MFCLCCVQSVKIILTTAVLNMFSSVETLYKYDYFSYYRKVILVFLNLTDYYEDYSRRNSSNSALEIIHTNSQVNETLSMFYIIMLELLCYYK